jgi:hypothetical protein
MKMRRASHGRGVQRKNRIKHLRGNCQEIEEYIGTGCNERSCSIPRAN